MSTPPRLFEDLPTDPSLADPLPPEPFGLFSRWLAEAEAAAQQPNPTVITVATVDPDGRPSARQVLCRGFDPQAGTIVFYTNRDSRKGDALRPGAYAAVVFHWDAVARQVRIEGPVLPSPDAESDAYFAQRPRPAQISAWASAQSAPIASRAALLEKLAQCEQRFGVDGAPVPRPPNWGGYRVYVESIELWVGSLGRAHDRALWRRRLSREADGYRGGDWQVARLQP
ncbi:MAG: pyridoxamine 5'-phosphate oxidase [Gammaproteobacteria bacterium]